MLTMVCLEASFYLDPAGAAAAEATFMQGQVMRTADQAQAMNQRLVRSPLVREVSVRI